MNNQQTLHEFIKAFLPPRGNKRKNARNELGRVSSVLSQVLLKYFGFRVTEQEVLTAFQELGYTIFAKKGVWNSEKKDVLPSFTGTLTRAQEPYADHDASHLYIDISADTIRLLGLLSAKMPDNTKPEKLAERDTLEARVLSFRASLPASTL